MQTQAVRLLDKGFRITKALRTNLQISEILGLFFFFLVNSQNTENYICMGSSSPKQEELKFSFSLISSCPLFLLFFLLLEFS